MKKLFVAALLTLGWATMAQAAEETQEIRASVYLSTTNAPASLAVTGPGVVYGITCSTGAATNFVVMRDTGTLNFTSTELLPKIGLSTSVGQTFTFPKPIRFTNGLEVNMGATTVDAECAVLYRKGKL